MFGLGLPELILLLVIICVLGVFFRPKLSKKKFERPISLVENNNEALYAQHKELGMSLWSQGDKEKAVAELERALKAKPDCVETWCKLGDCYDYLSSMEVGEKGNLLRQKAVDCLNKAISLQPANAKAHDMLGNVLWADDFKKALVEFEVAAKYDPQFEASVAHAKRVIAECTYKLSNLKTIGLKSLRERPLPQVYEYDFYFDGDIVKSAVMYSCVSGTKRQWIHAWLFSTENPDFIKEEPIGEVALASTGDPSVSKGCPSNYRAVIDKLNKEDLL